MVRFFLDPSYAPNDTVECTEFPFQIIRRGWGQFPVRVQLHFHTGDKPQNIYHNLLLDKNYTGLQQPGAETTIDIPLSRAFFEERGLIHHEEVPTPPVPVHRFPTITTPSSKLKGKGKTLHKPAEVKHALNQQSIQYLVAVVPFFPLVCHALALDPKYATRYIPAADNGDWRSWPPARRKAIEVLSLTTVVTSRK